MITKKRTLLTCLTLLLVFSSCEKDFEESTEIKSDVPISIDDLEVKTLSEEESRQKLDSLNLPFSSLNSKVNIAGRVSNSEGTILYDQVTQVIDQNGLQNITYKVIHPLTTSFRFYNLVISSDGTSTTAKLKEYIMTPNFHNRLVSNLSTMNDFEGVVNTSTVYTNNPCPEKDVNVVVANNNSSGGGIEWVEGFPSGGTTNYWNNFFSGTYLGTGVSYAGQNGGGGGNNPSYTDGSDFFSSINNFLNSVGSAISSGVSSAWSWIKSWFVGGCNCPNGARIANRGMNNSLVLILNPDDPNLDTTTFNDLPCPELGNTNYAVLMASDQNNNLASVSLATHTWWNETATTIQKNALLNFLFIKGYTAKNFQFIDNLVQLTQTHNVNIDTVIKFVLTLNAQQYSWFTNQNDFNQHDFSAVNQIAIFVSNNTVNNTISNENLSFVNELMDYSILEGNTSDSQEEINNILDLIDDGKINGEEVAVGPDTPITDMTDYLSCFNTSQGASITIYADQPKTGSHNLLGPDRVGHAFISIQQGSIIATLGFYPESSVGSIVPNGLTLDPTDFLPTPGVFGNDQGHTCDVSLTVPINSGGLTNLINGLISVAVSNPVYNLGSSNCTDIALLLFESTTSIDIPNCNSPRPYWNGQTPGTLGEVIRTMPTPAGETKNTNGGNAPNNNCN